ncbi:MAG: 1-acyl-sn-glycerol-3-phosphate acyltransferase [Clostridia bacterium]|nr:1-acyl-sn-glycerol-3-phosphate acyltransferase [Clostridia bacterium]
MKIVLDVIVIAAASAAGLLALGILFCFVCSRFVDPKKQYMTQSGFFRRILYVATGISMFIVRVKIVVEGREKLPDGRFLLVSNHLSNFDPIVTWQGMRDRDLAFISKQANLKIPIFGRIVRRCCFMPIDRSNPLSSAATINTAAELIETDQASVCVYPEGTRSRTGKLLPFHSGVLRIAQKAGVPVVVMTVRNSDKVKKRYPFRSTKIILRIIDVIPAEKAAGHLTNELGEIIKEKMLNDLGGREDRGETAA